LRRKRFPELRREFLFLATFSVLFGSSEELSGFSEKRISARLILVEIDVVVSVIDQALS
jgi:hypothetical protein